MNTESLSNLGDALGGVAATLPSPPPTMTNEALHEFGAAYARQAVRESRAERWRKLCPPAYLETNFADPRLAHNAPQLAKVLGWQYGPRGLLLAGPTGAGKTRSLWSLLRRLACDEGREFGFWNAQDLAAEITANVRFGVDEARAFIGCLARVPVLALDDLGQESPTAAQEDRVRAWLFRLFDRRVELGLPLLVSTNATAEQLAGTEGGKSAVRADPLMRRLLEIAEPVKFSPAVKLAKAA